MMFHLFPVPGVLGAWTGVADASECVSALLGERLLTGDSVRSAASL